MMGEVFPVVRSLLESRQPVKHLFVYHPQRRWGECPLDRFYYEISHAQSFTVSLVNEIPKDTHIVDCPPPWDRRRVVKCPNSASLLKVVEWLKKACRRYHCKHRMSMGDHEVVVQQRENEKSLSSYFRSHGSCGSSFYGRNRRRVLGLGLLGPVLRRFGYSVSEHTGDADHFYEQLAPYLDRQGMILCHGAGMVWMLFLRPGAMVLEISPPAMRANPDPDMIAQVIGAHYHRLYINLKGEDQYCVGTPVDLGKIGTRRLLRFSGFLPKGRRLRPTNRSESVMTEESVRALFSRHMETHPRRDAYPNCTLIPTKQHPAGTEHLSHKYKGDPRPAPREKGQQAPGLRAYEETREGA